MPLMLTTNVLNPAADGIAGHMDVEKSTPGTWLLDAQ